MRPKLFVVPILLLALLAACQRQAATPAPLTLAVPSWYAPEELPALQSAIDQSGSQGTPITVNTLVGKRDAVRQKIVLGLRRGDFADAVLIRNEWLPQLVTDRLVQPIPSPHAATVQAATLPALLPSVASGTGVWAIPFDVDSTVVWLRRDLAESAGGLPDPANWDIPALTRLAKAMRGESFGFAFSAQQYPHAAQAFLPWYFSNGGRLTDDAGRLTWDATAAAAALAWLKRMVDDGIAPSDVAALGQNDVFDGLAGGAYAMVLGGTWGRGMLDKQSTFADRMVALPVPGTGRRHGVTLLGGWSFVLAPTAKPGTAEFLMTLFGDVFQAKKLRERRYLPTHRAVLSDPWFTAHPDGATFRLALDRSLAMPLHPAAAEMLDVVATMLAETFLRRKSPPEAADDAARKIEALNQQR